jgi:hypothetical protein
MSHHAVRSRIYNIIPKYDREYEGFWHVRNMGCESNDCSERRSELNERKGNWHQGKNCPVNHMVMGPTRSEEAIERDDSSSGRVSWGGFLIVAFRDDVGHVWAFRARLERSVALRPGKVQAFRDGNVASTLESKKYATRSSSVSRRPRKDVIFSCISVVHCSVWLTIR